MLDAGIGTQQAYFLIRRVGIFKKFQRFHELLDKSNFGYYDYQ